MAVKIAVLIGSLRKESFNRMMAKVLIGLAPSHLELEVVEIGDLPFYNEDLETALPPPEWTAFREKIRSKQAVLFVTPEYNRSIPAVLKNAIDVGSRPYTKNVWQEKAAGIVTVSTGATGGFGSNHHLRQSLVAVDMPTMQQPEAYIGGAKKLFDESGQIANDSTKEFLQKVMMEFAEWAVRHA